eukprot:scaffold23640_cov132-Isochrysis_galbana.AAC.9
MSSSPAATPHTAAPRGTHPLRAPDRAVPRVSRGHKQGQGRAHHTIESTVTVAALARSRPARPTAARAIRSSAAAGAAVAGLITSSVGGPTYSLFSQFARSPAQQLSHWWHAARRLRGALRVVLDEPRAVDGAIALGQHKAEESPENALALFLLQRAARATEATLVSCPEIQRLRVPELLRRVRDVELVAVCSALERAALGVAVAFSVAGFEERPIHKEAAALGALPRDPKEIRSTFELRFAAVGPHVHVGHRRRLCGDVGEDKVVEYFLHHGVVVLEVGRDHVVSFGDDVGQAEPVEQRDEHGLLRRRDISQVLDANHHHHRDDGINDCGLHRLPAHRRMVGPLVSRGECGAAAGRAGKGK